MDQAALVGEDIRAARAFTLRILGDLLWFEDIDESRRLMLEGLALCEEIGDQWLKAWGLRELSRTYWASGDFDEARRLAEESLAIRRALGDRKHLLESLRIVAGQALAQGDLETAERLQREGDMIGREFGTEGNLQGIGATLYCQGKFSEAQTLYEEGWTSAHEGQKRHHLNTLNRSLGETENHLGRFEAAKSWGQRALETAKEIGFRSHMGEALIVLGKVALAEKTYVEARDLLAEGRTIIHQSGQVNKLGWVLASLALAQDRSGDLELSLETLIEALQISLGIGGFPGLIETIPITAFFLVEQGELERAVEIYALASRYGYVSNSRWWEIVVGQHIAAAAEAARARGAARELRETARELLTEFGAQA